MAGRRVNEWRDRKSDPWAAWVREEMDIVGQSDPSIPVPQELHSRERSSAPRTDSATSTEALVE